MSLWKKLLLIGTLIFLLSVGIGDYVLSLSIQKVTIQPHATATFNNAELEGDVKPINQVNDLGDISNQEGKTFPIYQGNIIEVTNPNSTSQTVTVIHNNIYLTLDFVAIAIGLTFVILSILGIFYERIIKMTKPKG
ncbi:MAG: hypothetical protein RQ872_00990 [Sulfolobaceae archaeon]|jgi:hypothetical protein|nr:hypothetical protein [Sulfolobaceae archaeon]